MIPFLIMEIADDDDRAYAQWLFESYHMMMLRIARRSLHDPAEAEDAVAETFVSLIRNLHKVRGLDEESRRAYIAVAVRRSCLLILRKKASVPDVMDDEAMAEQQPDTARTPDEAAICTYELDVMRKALSMLEETEQLMLYYKVVEEYRDAEIARMMGCSVQAMRTRFARLRRKLRMLCRELEQNDE